MNPDVIESLALEGDTKIVLLVLDGLGDLPHPERAQRTPLQSARTPNLDALAPASAMGRLLPVLPGVTPGSGPGHLGLFGYDPLTHPVGRGVLEALGAGMDLQPGDVAARANFCTVDAGGIVTDRRAGRIASEVCATLVERIRSAVAQVGDTEVILQPGKGHRFVALMRGPGLGGEVSDADPHKEGKPIPAARALAAGTANDKTASVINAFVKQANAVLHDEHPANAVVARGVSARPHFPSYGERFKLRAAAIAAYPMYRGVAQLAGMDLFVPTGDSAADAFTMAEQHWASHDYFFIHVKGTDMAGEDGDFDAKVAVIEAVDAALPRLMALQPNVLCVTGDHSTPVLMKGHSWHPVPAMIHGRFCFADGLDRFHEKNCPLGSMGTLASKDLMGVLLGNAGRLDKYGA
ncbi:MAG: 2,3-bisphosphoglycerate-independent phosphoglycerate mutase [Candidatus Eisenbacteria bacterium]